MSDYSQNGEQEHILKFFGDQEGRFLDLGAHDGMEGSNTRCLSDRRWRGVLVEANPYFFARLVGNHSGNEKMITVNAAVMPTCGLVQFHDTGSQVSTAMQNSAIDQWVQKRYYVASVTPQMLAAQFGCDFDFVSIDIEGLDLPVLRGCGELLSGTKLVCVEDSIPCKGFDPDYYNELLMVLGGFGFNKVFARTTGGGNPANTLISR